MKNFNFTNPKISKYKELWNLTIPLINEFEHLDIEKLNENQKIIYGLTKRIINIFFSIGKLLDIDELETKLILLRSMFDTQIIIEWLLFKKSSERIQLYLNGIDLDKKILIKKMRAGVSTTGQILMDLYSDEIKSFDISSSKRKNWSGKSIRELAHEIFQEKSYDIGYWMLSIYTHGSVLSIANEIELKKYQKDKLLNAIFDTKSDDAMAKSLVYEYSPIIIINIFEKICSYLTLFRDDRIE
jgi:hypothetical protein